VAPIAAPSGTTSEPASRVAALPDAKTGGFVVQLAALRAKDRARPAWLRLQKLHPTLLSDRELTIQQVDLGDRGIFFRVQAGFFAARAGARDLCNALKARGQDCLVVKR
jgi:cell division septation protein DedD